MAFLLEHSQLFPAADRFGDSTETVTLANAAVSGRLVVVVIGIEYDVRTFNVPSASNITFTQIGTNGSTGNPNGDAGELVMFHGVATGTVTAITCTTSGNIGDNAYIWVGEFSGNAATQTPQYNSAVLTAQTSHDSGSVTPSTAANLIIAVTASASATWTPDADFTTDALISDAQNRRVCYKIQSAATAQSYTSASDISRNSLALIAAFQGTAGDTTAPVLTSPTSSAVTSTTATVGVTTDENNGTLYAVVTWAATAPSVAQVKAGQTHTGSAAAYSGNQAISSAGAKTFSVTGLTTATTYYAHFVHTDAATNNSTVSSSAGFTTTGQLKLKMLVDSSATSATSGVSGRVFDQPTGGNITGALVGEFTNAGFAAGTGADTGYAVLKVVASTFDSGNPLSLGETPVAIASTSTHTTGIIPCTVIQE